MDARADVVIVGAGPVGLAAACLLQLRGQPVMVLDAAAAGTNTSRAAVIHARTLEVLEQVGLAERLVAEGVRVATFTVRDRSKTVGRVDFSDLPTRYPYTLMLPQSRTESLLSDRLDELGGTVLRGSRVSGVHRYDDGARVVYTAPDGTGHTVATRFVVGADGSHSVVREAVGIPFDGGRYRQSFVLADVTMSWPLPPDEVQLFFSPAGLMVVAPLPGGRHRVVATVDVAPDHVDLPTVQELLDRRGPGCTQVRDLAWGSRFRVQHRVARQYRRGAVFVAGDAAHVHSPAGGQGMNIGIQDGLDLAATLAEVLDGADGSTLDGYERRRRPAAVGVVRFTDRMTRAATAPSPVGRLRNLALGSALSSRTVRRRLALRLAELR